MSNPECVAKLDRAFSHLKSIEKMAGRWVDSYRVTHDDAPDQPGTKIVRLHATAAPRGLGLLIGECLHNARSFLDNLAFRLASAHSGAAFTPAMQQASEFPIFSARPPTAQDISRKIGGVHPDAQEIIKRLQPHNAADYRQDRLFHLHELDRINKHQFIIPAAAGHVGTGIGMPGIPAIHIEWLKQSGDPIAGPDGYAELMRYRGWHEIGGHRHMSVPVKVERNAVFPIDPFRGIAIAPALRGVLDHIRDDIVEALKPYF